MEKMEKLLDYLMVILVLVIVQGILCWKQLDIAVYVGYVLGIVGILMVAGKAKNDGLVHISTD